MDAYKLIYGTRAHNEFWDWLACGYYVQMHMYWSWGVKSCPDWNQIEGFEMMEYIALFTCLTFVACVIVWFRRKFGKWWEDGK